MGLNAKTQGWEFSGIKRIIFEWKRFRKINN
jgi:hypothetical protein